MKDEREKVHVAPREGWPLLLRISPRTLLLVVLGWLMLAWAMFIAVDIWGLVDLANFGAGKPLWRYLFNDHPVEWTQWFLLAFAIVAAAYLAGRLCVGGRAMASRFFLLFAIGLGLMLIEEAGDIRHSLSFYLERAFGPQILGLHRSVVSDVPYFAALAAVPLYALLRYGRYAWESVRLRFYLASGVMLYALAAIASGIRDFRDFYVIIGAWIDGALFGNRFPIPYDYTQATAHFFIVDSVIEESVELLAATMILAAILAFAGDLRLWQKGGE
ncbi:MAG: hypothetical protein R6V13_08625 [Anaerolineae bacterium]